MTRSMDLTPTAERIADEAETLIRSLGYNGFSYEDIARVVGIRKPSIHHHFPSKADLGAVVVKRYTQRFEAALQDIDGQHADPQQRLLAYAELFERTYAQNRGLCVCGMLGAEADALADEVNAQVRRFFEINVEWLTSVFAAGQSGGRFNSAVSALDRAHAYLCMLEGALVVARALPEATGPLHLARVWLMGCTDSV
jgi:TetR/AcrR family transcriptional repressor of nem operon